MPSSRSARRRRSGRSRNPWVAQSQHQLENADALAVSQSGDEEPMKGKSVLTNERLMRCGNILMLAFVAFGIGNVVRLAFSFADLDTSKAGPIVMVGLLALSIDTASKVLITIATPAMKVVLEQIASSIAGPKVVTFPLEKAREVIERAFEPITRALGASLAIFTVAYGLPMPEGENFVLRILDWSWASSEPEITASTGTAILLALRDSENINALVGQSKAISKIVFCVMVILLMTFFFIGIVSYIAKVVAPLI